MDDEQYYKVTRARLLAEGHRYAAKRLDEESARADWLKTHGRIPLRAMLLRWDGDSHSVRPHIVQGIALPDGRFIFGGNQTYSSEQEMLKYNPGAVIEWASEGANQAINYVTGD